MGAAPSLRHPSEQLGLTPRAAPAGGCPRGPAARPRRRTVPGAADPAQRRPVQGPWRSRCYAAPGRPFPPPDVAVRGLGDPAGRGGGGSQPRDGPPQRLFSAAGLLPIALSYGIDPHRILPLFLQIDPISGDLTSYLQGHHGPLACNNHSLAARCHPRRPANAHSAD